MGQHVRLRDSHLSLQEDGVRDADPLLCSQDPSTLDPTSSQFVSLSSSQLEEFELEGGGEGEEGAEFDLRDLEQSWDGSGTAGNRTDFVSVSEMHPLNRETDRHPNPHEKGQSHTRKRPHPDAS